MSQNIKFYKLDMDGCVLRKCLYGMPVS